MNDNFAKFLFVADRQRTRGSSSASSYATKTCTERNGLEGREFTYARTTCTRKRGGLPASKPTAASKAAMKSTLADYGSDSGDESEDSAEDEGMED